MNVKIDNLCLNIESKIKDNINDAVISNLVSEYVNNQIHELKKSEGCGGEEWSIRLKKAQSLNIVVSHIAEYNIEDISWSVYCGILDSIFKENKLRLKYILKYIAEIFLFIIQNTNITTKEIDNLIKYKEIFEVDMSNKAKLFNMGHWDKNGLYGYLWLKSKLEHLYIYKTAYSFEHKENNKNMIININCDNVFIGNLLREFINRNLSEGKFNKMGQQEYKQFIYYFEMSLINLNVFVSDITDFNLNTFKKQYRFYKKLNIKNNTNRHWNNTLSVLKEFYIFLIKYINENNINHNIFLGTSITINELINHNFNTYYENGYRIINKSGFIEMPQCNRWAIKSDSKVSSQSYKILVFDFTRIKNKMYREAFKNYVWYQSKLSIIALYSYSSHIISFLNFKKKFDEESQDYIFRGKTEEFSLEFLMAYKIDIMMKYSNQNSRINKFKAVRKYLLYYKDEYKITKLHLKYIATKSNNDIDINPVTKKDFSLLANEFTKRKSLSTLDELFYIIFNLKSTTCLRIGEILNIERESISVNNKDYIQVYTKTQQEERKKLYLSQDKLDLIKRAIELTEDIAKNAINEDKKYVFIIENKKFKLEKQEVCNVTKILSNRFRDNFNNIQNNVLGEVKYTSYNLRQMYKTIIYNEGSKENISFMVLEKLTGTQYKTDIKHYILRNDLNLYAEVFSGVTISDVNIKGEIITDDQIDKFNPVEDKLGACKSKACEIDDMFKCLICPNFVTTISRKNRFRSKIEANKIMIQEDIDQHKKNYLIAENKIYAAYYAKMINFENK